MVKHGLVFVWCLVPVTKDMKSIHETIESDESFSSLSDDEQKENQNHDQQPSHSTASKTPVKKPRSHQSQEQDKEHRKGGTRGSPKDHQQGREPRALVEYSDVSSEAFSEPEAGEITDSPGESPIASPRGSRQLLRSPSRTARLSPRPSPPVYSTNISRSPSFVSRSPLPRSRELHSDGEVESSPTPSHHTLHARPLVPYPVVMSPDRHSLETRGDYYRSRDPYHHSRTPSESERDHSRARKKEHKKDKKRKAKKHSRSERSRSPALYKKRKKKSKHKSRSGSPGYEDDVLGEGSVASSDDDIPEPVVIKRGIPSHDSRLGASSRIRSRGEKPSPLSSNDDDVLMSPHPVEINHVRGPSHSHRSRERTPTRRSTPHSPPAPMSPRHHTRHLTPPQSQIPSASKSYDRSNRLHHISPRRSATSPVPGQRRGNMTPPARNSPRRPTSHRVRSPPPVVMYNKKRSPSRSPIQYIEIRGSPDTPPHTSSSSSRYYASTSTSRREEKKKKKKGRDRDYHSHGRRSRSRSRSHSPTRSPSRSRGQSPRLVIVCVPKEYGWVEVLAFLH